MNYTGIPTNDNRPNQIASAKYWFRLLAILVGMEALMVSCGAAFFLFLMVTQYAENSSGAIVIFLVFLIFSLAIWVSAFSLFKGKLWSKGLIVTWQVIQFALATSFLQGWSNWQIFGWLLLVLSLVTFILTISKINTQP